VKPRLLDLFCGAGGAAVGYHRAGFDVVGVDNRPQPRYPFKFHQGDAMTWPLDGYDAIHASPPCQAYSSTRHLPNTKPHPELVEPTRERLQASGVPWVMENVVGAPLTPHIILCGTMFGLVTDDWELRRHRLFETSGLFILTPPCQHNGPVAGIYGGKTKRDRRRTLSIAGNFPGRENARRRTLGVYGHGSAHPEGGHPKGSSASLAQARALMDIDWMTTAEICQAIPPAYTEHIGAQLLDHLKAAVA
jgi:DNA (cytosine-5)-methyltransferase 1